MTFWLISKGDLTLAHHKPILMIRTVLIFLLLMNVCSCTSIQTNVDRQNVLMIAIDDLNDWLGCMDGHPDAYSPNIDQLASEGILFTNAHCQAPLCGPSRASLMTGLLPSSTGIYGQISDAKLDTLVADRRDITFLPLYFAQHGYKTIGIGKLFHNFAPTGNFEIAGGREKGFGPKPEKRFKYDPSWFNKSGNTQTDWGVFPEYDHEMPDARTAAWVVEQIRKPHDRPFFLAAGFLRPHVPWYVPRKWFDLFQVDSIDMPPYLPSDQLDLPEISRAVHAVPMMPTTEWAMAQDEWRHAVHAYLACIAFVDAYVGEILKALQESPYADNTIVVLWSDHGYHLGEKNRFAKHSLWIESSKTPLIIRAPGYPRNRKCTQPTQLLDIYPTLVELCGLPSNPSNEGHSLVPLLKDVNASWSHPAMTTYGYKNHAIRTERYSYLEFENGDTELYDLVADPNEWTNLSTSDDHQGVLKGMREFLPDLNQPWHHASTAVSNKFFQKQRSEHVH